MESPTGPGPAEPSGPPTPPPATEIRAARATVWALAGGKGGVGRSLLAANLGIQLARSGRRVVLVDLDLQGSNLHTYLGYPRLPQSLCDFASGKVTALTELAFETPAHHLRLIGGLQRGALRRDPVAFVQEVVGQFSSLLADPIIVDCGSGRSPATLAAFAAANAGILVTTPEPAALEALYLFADAHLRACLTQALSLEARAAMNEALRRAGIDPDRATFRAIMTRLTALDPAARDAIAGAVRHTRLELLLNQVRQTADEEAAAALQSGFRKCFGLSLHTAGVVEHDPSVLQAIQKRRPLSQQHPNTAAIKSVARTATRLLGAPPRRSAAQDEEWEDLDALDHYRILEVVPKASAKEVQTAYQVLKKTYDPETTYLSPVIEAPGLREMQARIEGAYRTLIFLESRASYDRQMLEKGIVRADQLRGLHTDVAEPHDLAPDPAATATPPPGDPTAAPPPSPAPEGTGSTAAVPVPESSSPPAGGGVARPVPIGGAELRAERQRQQQPLEAIAARSKIRTAYLQAIEEERFSDLPPAVFVRGFLREYAACLGLPGDEVARAYMQRYEEWNRMRAPDRPGQATPRRSIA